MNILLMAKELENIQLRDGDIVHVPIRLSTVTLIHQSTDQVYKIKNESVKELIKYAGGLKPTLIFKINH